MRCFLILVICVLACAQSVEVVPLTAEESKRLAVLNVEWKRLESIAMQAQKAMLSAESVFCAEVNKLKTSRKLKETRGQCGNGGWSGEVVTSSGTMVNGPFGTWEVDSTMHYLVHK